MNNTDYDYMIEVLTALKDGKTIQVRRIKEWYDIDINIENYIPKFNDYEYRIKPESRTINVRMALMQNGELVYTETVNDTEEENNLEKYFNYFQYWLTDWETYNIIPNKDS